MMLASPLVPARPFSPKMAPPDDSLSFRPARDVDAFNSLLPPPIEFVEGSSSGALAVPEGKYQPINISPKPAPKDRSDSATSPSSQSHTQSHPSPTKSALPAIPPHSAAPSPSLGAKKPSQPSILDLSWPDTCDRAPGLYNIGNTCFLNSALQCLLHTPPLLRVAIAHNREKCRAVQNFCMMCSFRQVAVQAHKTSSAFAPTPITNRLQTIAKHMRRGRQEDSHEFLRYAIDALQKSCLGGVPPKFETKLAETTLIYKIFGGKLRSRVTCKNCGHNSDTFDRILDLSVDILKAESLKEALRGFVAPDYLKGADKYKCEKCKKHVNAEKRFTIHEAPAVLTVHLKRFSPLGRKIGHHVVYDEVLSLHPYMSKDQFGPTYSLYGVICHAGGGPNSGHYFAYVKSKNGRWWEMNDEIVTPIAGVPVNKKTAYVLFYIRNKGQALQAALKLGLGGSAVVNGDARKVGEKVGLVAGMKKRREREDDDEDVGEPLGSATLSGTTSDGKFIGPLLPSPMPRSSPDSSPNAKRARLDLGDERIDKVKTSDPQADKVKQKIQKAKDMGAKKALALLGSYNSSDVDSDHSIGDESEDDDLKKRQGKEWEATAGKAQLKGKEKADRDFTNNDADEVPPTTPSSLVQPSSPISRFGDRTEPVGVPSPPVSSPVSITKMPNGTGSSSGIPDHTSNVVLERERERERERSRKRAHLDQMRQQRTNLSAGGRMRGYVNPFSRVGSENSLAARNGPGVLNTYGKRKRRKPRGL